MILDDARATSDDARALVRAILTGPAERGVLRDETVAALAGPAVGLVAGLLHMSACSRKAWLALPADHQLDRLGAALATVRAGYATMAPHRDMLRLRGTDALLLLAAAFGIHTDNWRRHFGQSRQPRRVPAGPVVVCSAERGKDGVLRVRAPIKGGGDTDDGGFAEHSAMVTELTAYLRARAIEPVPLRALRRTFFHEEGQPHRWNLGGRMTAVGRDNYQGVPLARRLQMTIEGRPVAEIDIAGAGLAIAHGLAGTPLDPDRDPYAIDDLPRAVVKGFIVEKFGPRGLPFIWRAAVARDLGYADAAALEADFPAKQLWRAIRGHYPLLKAPLDWAKIQYIESELVLGAVRRLAFEQDIPALPVHDSIIVPVHGIALAARFMRENGDQLLGCPLRLVVASRDPASGDVVRQLVDQGIRQQARSQRSCPGKWCSSTSS